MSGNKHPFKNFFSKDLHIKILSLIVAIAAWFGVMNTIAPQETKIYSAPIVFENTKDIIEQGYIISNIDNFANKKIDIGVKASRPALDELSKEQNKKDIVARVNMDNLTVDDTETFPQTFSLNVQPTLPAHLYSHSYNIISYSPAYLSVEIDKLVSAEHKLDVKTKGEPAEDYEISDTIVTHDTVTVKGPQSKIDNVGSVAVIIDVSDIKSNTNLNLAPVVYDKDGNKLSDFIIEPSHIGVELYVQKKDVIQINQPKTTGTLPPYLEISSLDWSPKEVNVTGAADTGVTGPQSIDVEPVDLTNIKSDTVVTRDISNIISKAGLSLKNKQDSKIAITIKLNLVNPKTINIKKANIKVIGLPETKTITLPEEVPVEIAGAADINEAMLSPSIDVTGLSDGEHSVKLNIVSPPNAAIQSSINVNVTIISKEPQTAAHTEGTESVTASTGVSEKDNLQTDNNDEENQ